MRWPLSLLFRGGRDTAPGDSAVSSPLAPALVAGEVPGGGVPPRPAAWRSLPPIQRSLGDAPVTVPAVPFGRELAGRRIPDPIIRPLAHDLAAEGPAGLVSGIATPLVIAPPAASADPATHAALPAPRDPERRGPRPALAPSVTSAAQPPAHPADDPLRAGTPPVSAPAFDTAAAPGAPPRVLPVVAASAVLPGVAATRVAAATAPETARATAPASGAGAAPLAAPAIERSAIGASPGTPAVPAGSPPAPGADGALAGRTPALEPSPPAGGSAPAGPPAAGAAPARPLSLGASRRLGLGAPLAGRPSVQRTATGAELPLARTARAAAGPVPSSAPPRHAAAAARALPELRVASDVGGPASAPVADEGPGGGAPVAPGAGFAATAVQRSAGRPLVGDAGRLAAPGLGADDVTARGRDDASAGDLPGGPDAVPGAHGAVTTGGVAAGPPGPAPSAAHATPPDHEPRAAGIEAPPLGHPAPQPAGIGAPAPGHDAAAVAGTTSTPSAPLVVARSLRGAQPLPAAGRAGAPPPAAAVPVPARHGPEAASSGPVSRPAGSRLPPGPPGTPASGAPGGGMFLARRTAPTPAAGESAAEPLPVSRLADDAAPATPRSSGVLSWSAAAGFAVAEATDGWAPAVQRAVAIDEATAAPPAGAASAGEGGGPGQDYEEIADRVYDRIRSRFANELLLDRERMGLLIDG